MEEDGMTNDRNQHSGEEISDQGQARSGNSSRGWRGDSQGHASAGRQGGTIVSQNREHMSEIGRKGGATVSKNREHMVEIGRLGGNARGKKRAPGDEASGGSTVNEA